jgi:hypothetical protein
MAEPIYVRSIDAIRASSLLSVQMMLLLVHLRLLLLSTTRQFCRQEKNN